MLFCDDIFNNLQLKDGLEEGVEFEVLDDRTFQYLYWLYGGTDIRRLSIESSTVLEEEVFLRTEPSLSIKE